MFSLIKQLLTVLLSFSSSLATKCISLNDEPCMIRPTLTDLNPVEFKYYPFMISLEKCNGSCNVLSPKICVPKKTKDINVKLFNMLTNKHEAKTMTKHISCDCKCKFNSTTCSSNQKWKNKTCQCEFKNYCKRKTDYSWIISTCVCDKSKYLKSIADNSVITCDEIISVMGITTINKYYSNKCNKTLS